MNKIDKSFTFFINTETINDEKCYVLHPLNGITSNTYYFNQKTGVFVRYYLGEQSPVELKSWNIDNGSAFIDLDAKDIEGVNLDKITSIFKKNG